MIDAIISGDSGTAVLVLGDKARIIKVNEIDHTDYQISSIRHFFNGSSNLIFRKVKDEHELREVLKVEHQKETTYIMLLACMNPILTIDDIQDCLEVVEEFLSEPQVFQFALDKLLSYVHLQFEISNISEPRLKRCHSIYNSLNRQNKLTVELIEELEHTFLTDTLEKCSSEEFILFLQSNSYIGKFVQAILHDDVYSFNNIYHLLLKDFGPTQKNISFLDKWLKRFKPGGIKNKEKYSGVDEVIEDKTAKKFVDNKTIRQKFENVNVQIAEITKQIKSRDIETARRFIDALVRTQVERGDNIYAAKSLCNIAQLAKHESLYSFQLELCRKAIDINNDDSWCYTQLGEAYFDCGLYDLSLTAFENSKTLGAGSHSYAGIAKIFRSKGNFESALSVCDKAIELFLGDSTHHCIRAEILRDLNKLDESLIEYRVANEKFPQNVIAMNGEAAVLKEIGRLEDSIEVYEKTLLVFPNDEVTKCGLADALKENGSFERSRILYTEILNTNSSNTVAISGYAELLKLEGRFFEGEGFIKPMFVKFTESSTIHKTYAELLADQKKYGDALKIYEIAAAKFPFNQRILNGRANVLKLMGNKMESLRSYDSIKSKFPHNMVCANARADVLKELKKFDDAIEAYQEIISKTSSPQDVQRAKSSIAAIYIVQNNFDEADALLSKKHPKTKADWFSYYLRCLLLLKSGNEKEAVMKLNAGLNSVKFYEQRKQFQKILALIALRSKKLEKVKSLLRDDNDPITNVLGLHYFCEKKDFKKAKDFYNEVYRELPFECKVVTLEIASYYSLIKREPKFDENWIYKTECDLIILNAA